MRQQGASAGLGVAYDTGHSSARWSLEMLHNVTAEEVVHTGVATHFWLGDRAQRRRQAGACMRTLEPEGRPFAINAVWMRGRATIELAIGHVRLTHGSMWQRRGVCVHV